MTTSELIGRPLGDFIVRHRLGEGGFGEVYRAEQPALGREAVIKVLHGRHRSSKTVAQRFLREARLASKLDHPYAAHIYAFGVEPDGLMWIAMELVKGQPLSELLRRHGQIPIEQLVSLLDRICEVLQAAHDMGIVHRDIKPANVMVIQRAGRVFPKLLDFGIAKLRDGEAIATEAASPSTESGAFDGKPAHDTTDASGPNAHALAETAGRPPAKPDAEPEVGADAPVPSDTTVSFVGEVPGAIGVGRGARVPWPRDALATKGASTPRSDDDASDLTEAGATVGSPPYMAPEQWEDSAAATARTDLYALGITTYEALTGRRPFSSNSMFGFAIAHATLPVPALGTPFPPELDAVMAKVLAKQPGDRYKSALEFAQAFRTAAGFSNQQTLPSFDDELRVSIETSFPQPIAEAVAAFQSARNPHQARDALRDIVVTAVRYVALVALASHAQVRLSDASNVIAVAELVRELRRRTFGHDDWVRLARELVAPFRAHASAHPIPELVTLFDGGFTTELSGEVLAQRASEPDALAAVRALLPEVTRLLRSLTFLADYPLVVITEDRAESWMGVRRPRRIALELRARAAEAGRPLLIDASGRATVALWPVMQISAPMVDAPPELFLLEGKGRRGAKLRALPQPLERQDEQVWDWLGQEFAERGSDQLLSDSAGTSPYRGLRSFTADDAELFIGREREVDAAVNRLRVSALVAVVGPSGAGKSSFVHAGVLPSLPEGWEALSVRPGPAPLVALEARLRRAGLPVTGLSDAIANDPAALGEVLRTRPSPTVLVIDQFEELFTLGVTPEVQRQYVRALMVAADPSDDRVRVVLTLRDDFLARATQLAELRDRLPIALFLLGTPARTELLRILTEPLARRGYEFDDPQLAERMVDDVADTPGALALASFTAQKLWELRDRHFRQLTRRAYDGLGGVVGALAKHAESTLAEMTPGEQRLARVALGHLVTADGTRAILSRSELEQLLRDPHAASVIEKLVAARLLTATETEGGDRIELVHEALIAAWPRLGDWRREDAEGARLRDQVRAAARQWIDRKRPRGLLWREEALTELRLWHARHQGKLTDVETEFAAASFADARRVTWRRRAVAGGLVAVVIGAVVSIYVGVRIKVRGAVEREVAAQLELAAPELAEARSLDDEVERNRAKAFAAFDAKDRDRGEVAWTQALDGAAKERDLYRQAGQHIETAINTDPTDARARAAFADVLLARARAAERDALPTERDELVARMRLYDDGSRERWLEQPAHLEVRIDPPDLAVTLSRATPTPDGKRTWQEPRALTVAADLQAGSYLLVGHAPGRAEVRLAVLLERGERRTVSLSAPPANEVPDGFVYIPAGRFLFGSSRDESRRTEFLATSPLHARETGAYLIATHETTWAEWIEFLNTLPQGERARRTPQTANPASTGSVSLRSLPNDGWELTLQPTQTQYRARDGESIHYEGRDRGSDQNWHQMPVSAISATDAVAYTHWLDQTGKRPGARLCTEEEWERAARGADDRELPSGDHLAPDDADFDLTYKRNPPAFGPDVVGTHPVSRSPYGLDDMTGNVYEWTVSSLEPNTFVVRGGDYYHGEMTGLSVNRQVVEPTLRDITVGLRVCADIRPR